MADPAGDSALLSVKEVAKRLDCSSAQVWRLVREGKLSKPVEHAGKRWYAKDLEVYLWRLARGDFDAKPDDEAGKGS